MIYVDAKKCISALKYINLSSFLRCTSNGYKVAIDRKGLLSIYVTAFVLFHFLLTACGSPFPRPADGLFPWPHKICIFVEKGKR